MQVLWMLLVCPYLLLCPCSEVYLRCIGSLIFVWEFREIKNQAVISLEWPMASFGNSCLIMLDCPSKEERPFVLEIGYYHI